MRRSGRKPREIVSCDIETYDPTTQRFGGVSEQSIYFRSLPKEEQRKIAKHGWRNWYINRGRLPLEGDRALERRISWRRIH